MKEKLGITAVLRYGQVGASCGLEIRLLPFYLSHPFRVSTKVLAASVANHNKS